MKLATPGLAAALAMLTALNAGCGEHPQQDLEITRTTGALGSTEGQQTVGSWNELVSKMSPTANLLLTGNIDATNKTWNPNTFSGTFDGGTFTISNLTINVNNGFNAGFFTSLLGAIVRRVRFVNLKVTGDSNVFFIGGLAGWANSSVIEDVGVEVNVTGPGATYGGGLVGQMSAGSITRSYTKGSINSVTGYAGGLVGTLEESSGDRGTILQAYSTATVSPNTSGSVVYAGGLVGYTFAGAIQEVYATGNVTGRGFAGGLVGFLDCSGADVFVLNHGIYRGNVTDMNRPPPSGWAGVAGGANDCTSRFDQLWWDQGTDTSTVSYVFPPASPSFPVQQGYSDASLKSPTTASGGVYHFADNNLQSTIWSAGTSSQHHVLQSMPGGLGIQPR